MSQLTQGESQRLMYVENKDGEIDGHAARIGWVKFSKTGRTIHLLRHIQVNLQYTALSLIQGQKLNFMSKRPNQSLKSTDQKLRYWVPSALRRRLSSIIRQLLGW